MNNKQTFSILITTKNRINDLKFTLVKITHLLERNDVECVICDDGSTDGTAHFLKNNYPNVQLIQNEKSEGLIYSRNKLLNLSTADFAISLDDDAHFLTENPLTLIENYFNQNPNCGLIATRIFWGINEPKSTVSNQNAQRVQGFVGCAHVWRMSAWHKIPNYPAWFVFYGEEDFASYQLFKKNIEIHYLPAILVHHRVDIKNRKKATDYYSRARKSYRSALYLYGMFLPKRFLPKTFAYIFYANFKNKVLKGDYKMIVPLLGAYLDFFVNSFKVIRNINRLSISEYKQYKKLPEAKIYWQQTELNVK